MGWRSRALGPGEPGGGDSTRRLCSKHSVRNPIATTAMRENTAATKTRVHVDIVMAKGFFGGIRFVFLGGSVDGSWAGQLKDFGRGNWRILGVNWRILGDAIEVFFLRQVSWMILGDPDEELWAIWSKDRERVELFMTVWQLSWGTRDPQMSCPVVWRWKRRSE